MIEYDNKEWFKHIFVWRGSVLKGTLIRVLIFVAWTAMITFFFESNIIPKIAKIDMVVFNIVGLALGLLLVFRTNTSYDRWWEGRKLLGANVNASRNIAFTLDNIIPKEDRDSRDDFLQLFVSFHFAVKERLRDGVKPEHLPMLNNKYHEVVFNSHHAPNAIMKLLRSKIELFRANNLDKNPEFLSLYTETHNLINNMGGMERIRFTPVPFAYASHLQLFILVYLLALPFGLNQNFGWMALPVMGFITLILVGINDIGVEIEDPFGDDPNDLPVDNICENIKKNMNEILTK